MPKRITVADLDDAFDEPSDLAQIAEVIMNPRTADYDEPCPKCGKQRPGQYIKLVEGTVRCRSCGVSIHESYFDPEDEQVSRVLKIRESTDREDLLDIANMQGIDWVLDRLREGGYIE